MRSSDNFKTRVHGKWILAGEHAVLRGSPALAFPVYGKFLELRWREGEVFSSRFLGDRGEEFQLLFAGVFDRALALLAGADSRDLRRGQFEVESTLPVGAGLGASAALSVAMGRWFESQGALKPSELFEFCRQIENLFHGESSGVDVAVALESRGLRFQRGAGAEAMQAFDPIWEPRWYISSSGARGITSECVAKVKRLLLQEPERGQRIDQAMREAVAMAETALIAGDQTLGLTSGDRFELLTKAIRLGARCFEEWGLAGGELGEHMQWLAGSGAEAVKPTGSGGGGYALSLWRSEPPAEVLAQLIPVFREKS